MRRTINIMGVNDVYAGRWRISQARHTITVGGSTYSVSASLKRSGKDGEGSSLGNANNKQSQKDNTSDTGADESIPERTAVMDFETREVRIE